MDLSTYFITLCRQLGVRLKTESPAIKALVADKKATVKNGAVARFNFGSFYMDIYYIENIKGGAQQVIWVSFFFDSEQSITFSLYDILSVIQPDNFNCYTYSFVDSGELLRSCLGEITELLEQILPSLTKIAENGVEKNHLIEKQKQKVNEYFGDNITEAENLLSGSAGEKIISMMFYNFFQYQIDTYIFGSPAVFFAGKDEKALKRLKKAKHRTLYEDNLLLYLENGGKALPLSEAARSASAEKGTSRQGTDAKGALKLLLYIFLFDIPISVLMAGMFFLMSKLISADSPHIFGIAENLIFIPFYAVIPSIAAALNVFVIKKNRNPKIHNPPLPPRAKNTLKYFTIIAESIALIMLFTCVNSTLVLRNNDFLYSEEDFPLSRISCKYSSVDYVAIVDGYAYNGEFQEDKHIVFVTKSGSVIDLYNSTFLSSEEFRKETETFLKEKNIETKEFKTIEDTKKS